MDTISEEKKRLRKTMKVILREFAETHPDTNSFGEQAFSLLQASSLYTQAHTILTYISTDTEINTQPLIKTALQQGKEIAVPKTDKRTGEMTFFFLEQDKPLEIQTKKGAFDILEPLDNLRPLSFKCFSPITQNTIIIIPGVSFSRTGKRLGHGCGYYDKYISQLYSKTQTDPRQNPIPLIGFCYNFQLVENIPTDDFDIPMTHIVTEKAFLTC